MQMIRKYLFHLEMGRKAENTIITYRYHLTRFHDWRIQNNIQTTDITTKQLVDFKEELQREGKAERTINAIISCVRGYYDYLILTEVVTANPVADALSSRVKSVIINPLTQEQIKSFHNHVNDLKVNIRAAFHVMMATGARVGEVAALTKGDFRIVNGRLLIRIEDAKWGSDREIPMMLPSSAKIVKDYIDSIDVYREPAFRVTKRTLQTYADNFRKSTGIPLHCHIIRHTFASSLLDRGVPIEKIQFLLGHKTVNMTRHYTQGANIDVMSLAPTIWQAAPDQEAIRR